MEPPELGATDETLLDRYWDEVVLGLAGTDAGLDPTDMAAIQQLHRHVRLRGTDGTFGRRLRRDLLRTPTLPVSSGPSAFTPDRTWQQGATPRSSGSRSSWLTQAVAVLLLIGTVVLLVFAVYGRRPDQPVVIVLCGRHSRRDPGSDPTIRRRPTATGCDQGGHAPHGLVRRGRDPAMGSRGVVARPLPNQPRL